MQISGCSLLLIFEKQFLKNVQLSSVTEAFGVNMFSMIKLFQGTPSLFYTIFSCVAAGAFCERTKATAVFVNVSSHKGFIDNLPQAALDLRIVRRYVMCLEVQ